MTNHDWPLRAAIQGPGFFGPPMVLAKAYNTTKYPLVFKPQNETIVQVRSNKIQGFFPEKLLYIVNKDKFFSWIQSNLQVLKIELFNVKNGAIVFRLTRIDTK